MHGAGAFEDAVNAEFIKKVGVILAQAREDGTDQHDYIDRLVDLYETTIDELPDPYPEDD